MSESALDSDALVRTLLDQQSALIAAFSESTRLQRVLVERVLGTVVQPVVSAAPDATRVASVLPPEYQLRSPPRQIAEPTVQEHAPANANHSEADEAIVASPQQTATT